MSEKLYLPVSILLSALIVSGTIFMASSSLSASLTGLTVAAPTGLTGTTVTNPPAQTAPTQQAPPAAAVNMASVLEGAYLIHGNENSSVKLVEFSDFECPFCGSVEPTLEQLKLKYGDQIAIYYQHFPLSFHPQAKPAALASECAAEQGKFAEYHAVLFANQQALNTASYKQWAADLGLNTEQFNSCFDSGKYNSVVDDDFALGSLSGVSGTPTFFIGAGQTGQKLVGAQPQASFEAVIDNLLP